MTKTDLIEITGNPPAWQMGRTARALVSALRGGRWVSRRDALVLSVSCVSAGAMARLNRKHRGRGRATDVLSFEQGLAGAPRGMHFLGDVVLCLPVVRRQAKERRHGVRAEAAVLLAHALLHLLGYDHERGAAQARRMAAAEARLLRLAGFGRQTAGLVGRAGVKGRYE